MNDKIFFQKDHVQTFVENLLTSKIAEFYSINIKR